MLNLVAIPAAWSIVFDTSTMSYILPSAECDLNLANLDKGILNAMVYGGKQICIWRGKDSNVPCLVMFSVVTVSSKIILKSNLYVTETLNKCAWFSNRNFLQWAELNKCCGDEIIFSIVCVCIFLTGMISGAFFWGFFSDTIGRHKLLIAGYYLLATVVVLSSFSQAFWILTFFKFLGGFAYVFCNSQNT
jgi:MFS family permease